VKYVRGARLARSGTPLHAARDRFNGDRNSDAFADLAPARRNVNAHNDERIVRDSQDRGAGIAAHGTATVQQQAVVCGGIIDPATFIHRQDLGLSLL
jgi:hypothetical protein